MPTTTVRFLRRVATAPIARREHEALATACLVPKPLTVPKKKPKITKFTFKANLKWLLSSLTGGEATCVEVLRQAPAGHSDFETIQALLAHWDAQTDVRRRSLDLACIACDVQPATVYGWFAEMSFSMGLNIMRVQLAAAAPIIMQTSIDRAQQPDGLDERKVLFESIGLTQRRGIAIQNNIVNRPAANDDGYTDGTFESDQRRVSGALREAATNRLALPEKRVDGSVVQKGE